MRRAVAWFAVPAAVAWGATMALAAPASAAVISPQIIRVDGGGYDRAYSIAVDPAGNTYLGGALSTGPNSQGGFSVVKVSPQGTVVWRANYSGNDGNFAPVLTVGADAAGNVYAAGYILRGQHVGAPADTVLVKFGPTGQEIWSQRTPGGPGYQRIVATNDGFVVAGNSAGTLLVQRFDTGGTQRWSRSLGVGQLADLALAPNGNVVVAASTNGNGDGVTWDYDTTVLDPQGATVWRRVFTVDGPSHEVVSDIAVDPANRVIVTGTTAENANPEIGAFTTRGLTVRYAADGTLTDTVATGSTAVDVDPAGNAYLVGFTSLTTPDTVTKLDSSFQQVYRTTVVGDPVDPLRLASAKVDSTGVVTVAGNLFRTGVDTDYLTIRYGTDGQELGRHRFNGTANFTDQVLGVVVTAQDTALVTGTSRSINGGRMSDDIVTLRFGAGVAPDPVPAAPGGLTATATSRSRIELRWSDNASNETGFRIERCQGAGCTSFTQIATVGPNVTSFANTGLARNTSYTYRVQAVNASGGSGFSNTATATTRR